ncbi:trypsin-like serine protease [Rhodobacteraceae bacterium M385]|nr:trypsin-like serine protease [Rhodobacteraceae bacterium M385]
MGWSFFAGVACAVGVAVGASFPALAQGLPQVQLTEGHGGLRALNSGAEAQVWRGVGRLDTGASFCTATLIRENLVLTAAHCVFHPQTSRAFDASDLTFLAGLRNGHAEAVRNVRRIIVLPGYHPEQGPDFDMIGRDLALLELSMPISMTSIVPISTARTPWREGRVTVVSYGREREGYASIEEGCEILQRQESVRAMNCQVVSGASGSPVVRVNQGRAEVVAVISASAQSSEGDVSLAVMLEDHLATLMSQYRASASTPVGVTTLGGTPSFIVNGADARSGIGARFIRP